MDNNMMTDVTAEQMNSIEGGWDWKQAAEGCLFGLEVGAAMGFFLGGFGAVPGAISGCLHGAVIGGLDL